jgi:catechol 2,3-dioxygenase-like lactoylglutathione lyase family enzyme
VRISGSHPLLAVHDLDRSGSWYRDVLGCEVDDPDPGNWRFCRAGDVIFMLGRCPDVQAASELAITAMSPTSTWTTLTASTLRRPLPALTW